MDQRSWDWARMMVDPHAKSTQKKLKSDELDKVKWYGATRFEYSKLFGFYPKVFIHVSISWHTIPNIQTFFLSLSLIPLTQPQSNDTARFIRFIVLLFREDFFPLLSFFVILRAPFGFLHSTFMWFIYRS